jgi:DNA-binding protein HU-beta
MNKQDLVTVVSSKSGLSKTDSSKAVDATLDAVMEALSGKDADEVRLVGFGTFSVAKRAASEGRNPRTGEKIKIKARKSPKFKAGKEFGERVNK